MVTVVFSMYIYDKILVEFYFGTLKKEDRKESKNNFFAKKIIFAL
jgi:hypothetical protein